NLTLKYHEQNKAYLEMYEYDAQGNVIKSSNLSGNIMFTYSFQRKYDSTGTVNTETTITPPDDLIRYTYDNTGNCIRLDYYSSPVYKPEICSKYYFTYNEQNQMTQSAFHLENDTLYNMYKWEYDSAGHCTREMYILAGDTSLITQHTYDSLGNRIETIEYGLFSSYYKRTTYNSQGLIDHVIEYDQYRKRLVYYRYVYSFY
ncbi:MAG TPA: hypothetical protein VK826_09865, partial [Bacteroidia bacterium]|nr:hypothetical protein [Bacteroidia bacterium]